MSNTPEIRCKLCHELVKPGDQYYMQWHEPKQWYVLNHKLATPRLPGQFKPYCGLAAFRLEDGKFVRRSSMDITSIPAEGMEVRK